MLGQLGQGLTSQIKINYLRGLVRPKPRRATGKVVPTSMLLDSALVDAEQAGQFIDGYTVGVALDQILDPGWVETSADTPWGSSFGRFGPRWHHFHEVPEAFSLVRMVQVTSHYLHPTHILPGEKVERFLCRRLFMVDVREMSA